MFDVYKQKLEKEPVENNSNESHPHSKKGHDHTDDVVKDALNMLNTKHKPFSSDIPKIHQEEGAVIDFIDNIN